MGGAPVGTRPVLPAGARVGRGRVFVLGVHCVRDLGADLGGTDMAVRLELGHASL